MFECVGVSVFIGLIYCYRSLLIKVILFALMLVWFYFLISLLAYKLINCNILLTMRKYTPSTNIFDILYHYLSTYLYNSSYCRLYYCLSYIYKGVVYQSGLSFFNKLKYLSVVVLNIILFSFLDCSKLIFSFLVILIKALLQSNRRPYVYTIRELNNLIKCSYFFKPEPRIIHLVYGIGIRINPFKKIKRGELVEVFGQLVSDFGRDAIKAAVSNKLPAARIKELQDLKQVHVASKNIDGSGRVVGHNVIYNSKGFGYQLGTSNNQKYFTTKSVEFGCSVVGKSIYGRPALIIDQTHTSIAEDWNTLQSDIVCEFYHKLLSGSQKNIELFEFSGCDVTVKFINVDMVVKKYGVPKMLFDIPYIDKDTILTAKNSKLFNEYFDGVNITSL